MINKNNYIDSYDPKNRRDNDEIDLYELITQLWKRKIIIFFTILVCGSIGIAYALTAPEQWTTKTVIYQPKQQDTLMLEQLRNDLNIQGLAGVPNNDDIYSQFLLEFKSYDNLSSFLSTTPQFKEYSAKHNLSELGQQRLLRKWSQWMIEEPEDRKGDKPGIRLSFSFFEKDATLELLTGYIKYIIELQNKEMIEVIERNKTLQINSLKLKIKLLTEDTRRQLDKEIKDIEYSMSIASAAGVNRPLENFNYSDRFAITLGKDGLAKKLAILKSLKPEDYRPEILDLNVQLHRLENINIQALEFRPFSYLDTPSQPLTRDKPKRPLIVALSLIIGAMLGIGLVLIRYFLQQGRERKNVTDDYQSRLANVI